MDKSITVFSDKIIIDIDKNININNFIKDLNNIKNKNKKIFIRLNGLSNTADNILNAIINNFNTDFVDTIDLHNVTLDLNILTNFHNVTDISLKDINDNDNTLNLNFFADIHPRIINITDTKKAINFPKFNIDDILFIGLDKFMFNNDDIAAFIKILPSTTDFIIT